jgi:hypothetical protein
MRRGRLNLRWKEEGKAEDLEPEFRGVGERTRGGKIVEFCLRITWT